MSSDDCDTYADHAYRCDVAEQNARELVKRVAELECRMVDLPPIREPSEFVTDVDGYVYY